MTKAGGTTTPLVLQLDEGRFCLENNIMMLATSVLVLGLCAVVGFALLVAAALAVVWVLAQEKSGNSKNQ